MVAVSESDMYQIGFRNDIFLVWTLNGVTFMKLDLI